MLDSTTTAPSRPSSGAVKSRVEPQAKSRLGEPPFDETSTSRDDPTTPPPPPKPLGSGPAVQGPTTLLSPSSRRRNDSDAPASTGSSRVRQASLSDQLKPFLDESSANELIYPNKADRPWRYVVLHHSAAPSGSYDQIDSEHRKILGIEGCGYHFVIGNGNGSGDGQIEVAQRWTNQKQGIHCRNARTHDVDEYGIGICLVGDLDKEPPTPRQIAAAKALVAHLSSRYNIAQARVQTHAAPGRDQDRLPGSPFPGRRNPGPLQRTSTNQAPGSRGVESRPRSQAELLKIRQHNLKSHVKGIRGRTEADSHLFQSLSRRRTASCRIAITLNESVIWPALYIRQASCQLTLLTAIRSVPSCSSAPSTSSVARNT